MGKYMRKSKATGGGVALMELSHTQASLGVRTRARVALERLQKSATAAEAAADAAGGGSYLQLRSRRLEKITPTGVEGRRQKNTQKDSNLQSKGQGTTNEKPQGGRGSSRLKVKGNEEIKEEKGKVSLDGEKVTEEENLRGNEAEENKKGNQSSGAADLGVDEAFFGENVLEFEGRGRNTRESTPCSLIRDPDSIRTPGSCTRLTITTEVNNRENSLRRHIPTANEMDEFFAHVEEQQQKQFIEKYNFDPVNDKPLPGRFEWEKLNP